MNLTITAVGSSTLIANEIRTILESLLPAPITITICKTNDVTADMTADIYVCAQTQYQQLLTVIPANKILILDLTPSSTYFMEISRIPRGKKVCIFNNRFAYPQMLKAYCQSLGIAAENFQPLAFEEMPLPDVLAELRQAEYIIGVDQFLNHNVLLSEPYKSALQKNVHIIAGRRTVSLPSSFALLHRIASITLKKAADLRPNLPALPAETTAALLQIINQIIDIVQTATIQSVVNQASIQKAAAHDAALSGYKITSDQTEMLPLLDTRLAALNQLNEKLHLMLN